VVAALVGLVLTGCATRTDYAPSWAPCIHEHTGRQIPAGSVCAPGRESEQPISVRRSQADWDAEFCRPPYDTRYCGK